MWLNKVKINKGQSLLVITLLLAVYYLYCALYLHGLGYTTQESIFYAEKVRIIFEGVGYKLKIIGLTSPILPFFATFAFTSISSLLAPIITSAIGTSVFFYIIASTLTKKINDDFYLLLLIITFLFHPGILYAACSGKSIYLVLIFFFMFFLNLFKFYTSNTTFHISIASICLVLLLFCDYKFIWLTIFFIPLIFSIAVQTLNLAEKESIFRMSLSFNNPSLRRKLVNKTFALYIILFILPIASVTCYKLLNLTNANDVDYFMQSPYATWTVLADKLNYDLTALNPDFKSQEISLLISAKMLAFCPLMLFAFYLFRQQNYQILTLLTPFAFVEFLHIKYDRVFLTHQYYLIFLILALLCLIFKAQTIKNQLAFKIVLGILILIQVGTGYYFLNNSAIEEEKTFMSVLINRTVNEDIDEDKDMADYINGLPDNERVLVDDAIAYKIVAYTNHIPGLILPYQDNFLGAIERPGDYANYILIATNKNLLGGYSILNYKYPPVFYQAANNYSTLQKVYQTDKWALYKFL
jgi:hypothetical protein